MRKTFIAGNWKMNLDRAGAIALAEGIAAQAGEFGNVEVGICPASVHLDAVGQKINGSPVALGAQNMYFEPNGAFTGETSAAMLNDIGCKYVILGHSERRHVLGESDELINQKVKVALDSGLNVILCVGELLEEREADQTAAVNKRQLEAGLNGVSAEQMANVVIAYEPVWAIGTGKVASPEQAEAVHVDLRKLLTACYNTEIAESVRIQYGGSVKPSNASDLLSQPNIDGALVGGASLKVDDFLGIITAQK